MKAIIQQNVLLLISLLMSSCAIIANTEDTLPECIREKLIDLDSAPIKQKNEINKNIVRLIWPESQKNLHDKGDLRWKIHSLQADLTGDYKSEHLFTVWHDSEYRGAIAIYGVLPDGRKFKHLEVFDTWAYRPPEALIINNESKEKYVICRYESITHATGLYESRMRILRWIDGRFHQLADIPEKYHSSLSSNKINFVSCQDDFRLDVKFRFLKPNTDEPLVTGDDVVWLEWNETRKKLLLNFGDGHLNSKRWSFIMKRKNAEDKEFLKLWSGLVEKNEQGDVRKSNP